VNQKQIVLTVVTAVYNGEDYICETIDSVLRCAESLAFEYIVVNDGSTDHTLELLKNYGEKIRIVNHDNCGESASVTKAFHMAQGEFLIVVSADDPLLTKELFVDVFDWFLNDPQLVAVYPDWQMIDPIGKVIQTVIVPDYSDELLIGQCRTLPGPGVIFRQDAAVKIGGRRARWTYVGDYDFWLRLSRLGEIRHRPGVLAQWRHHANSTSVSKRGIGMARERIAVVEDFLAENLIDPLLARKALGHAYYTAARLSFFDSDIPGKRYLFEAFVKRRGWITDAKLSVIGFILLDPISRWIIAPIRFLRVFRIRNL
jgi:glycosyltransferase involved in cell wall biosynthesis